MTARIQPGMRVRHIELSFGEGVVLAINDACVPPTAIVRWENGQQSSVTLGMLEKLPAYASASEL